MPTWGYLEGPEQYRRIARLRQRATDQLVAKGMIPGHGKFDSVVRDKVTRWMRNGVQ